MLTGVEYQPRSGGTKPVTLSLPLAVIVELDLEASRRGVSRSALVSEILVRSL